MYLSDYLCIGYIILNNNSNSDKNIHNFRYFTIILTHIISHVSTRHVRFRVCWNVWFGDPCTVLFAKTIFVQRRLFRRPLLCDGVYAGTPTAGIVNFVTYFIRQLSATQKSGFSENEVPPLWCSFRILRFKSLRIGIVWIPSLFIFFSTS